MGNWEVPERAMTKRERAGERETGAGDGLLPLSHAGHIPGREEERGEHRQILLAGLRRINSNIPGGVSGKGPTCQCRRPKRLGRSPGGGMATHSWRIPAWRIPRTDEPGGLQSIGSQRVWTRLKQWSTHTHKSNIGKRVLFPRMSLKTGMFLRAT